MAPTLPKRKPTNSSLTGLFLMNLALGWKSYFLGREKMNRSMLLFSALSMLFLTAFNAEARWGRDRMRGENKRIQLRYFDQHLRGQNILTLKKKWKEQNPRVNFERFDLVAVRLVAKSKMGRGQAKLVVGQEETYSETIGGRPNDFHDQDAYTYSRVRFENPKSNSKGKWQIHLRGNFKIKKVVLIVKPKSFGRRLKLNYYGEHMRGQNTLFLKRKIRQEYPNMDLSRFELKGVQMVAKSKHGGGKAKLVVGQNETYEQTVAGSPRGFHRDANHTYDSVSFENPSYYGSQGKWQIHLRGNFKVQSVIIKLQRK
jgi:hypothetical protein